MAARCVKINKTKFFVLFLAWTDRWWAMLGAAVQDALAASLLADEGKRLVVDRGEANMPELDALLDGQRWAFEDKILV